MALSDYVADERKAPFIVRDAAGRHLDHPAWTQQQADALRRHFEESDLQSRPYVHIQDARTQ